MDHTLHLLQGDTVGTVQQYHNEFQTQKNSPLKRNFQLMNFFLLGQSLWTVPLTVNFGSDFCQMTYVESSLRERGLDSRLESVEQEVLHLQEVR